MARFVFFIYLATYITTSKLHFDNDTIQLQSQMLS